MTSSDDVPGLRALRRDYSKGELLESEAAPDPLQQFGAWLQEAIDDEAIDEAHAMNVATVEPDGTPSSCIVLLRGFDANGFTFFTNYNSAKGRAIDHQPRVALVFYWGPLEREVRITGRAEQIDAGASNEYWASRPYKSKLGALVSQQSAVIQNRDALEHELTELEERYPDGSTIPRPTHWGGYQVAPETIEFWQGRRSRLHDRLRYRRTEHANWIIERLAP